LFIQSCCIFLKIRDTVHNIHVYIVARAAKKTETPKLWLRLAEEWSSSCVFGEVRLAEQGLMEKHGINSEQVLSIMTS
jgi:hypothetical protein